MVSSRSFPPARKEKERTGWKKIEKEADRYESVRGKLRLKLGRSLYYLHRQEAVHRANYLFIYLFPNKYHLSSPSHLSPSLIPAASSLSLSLSMCHITSLHHRPSWFVWGFLHCSTLCHQWLFRFLHISILLRFNNREISVVLLISHFSLYLLELTPTALN